jgi:hypothetical protein
MAIKFIDLSYTTAPSSVAPLGISAVITGISQATTAVVLAASHGFVLNDVVAISGVVGMVEVNDRTFVVSSASTNQFSLTGINSTGYTAYSSGGVATKLMTVTGNVRVLYDDATSNARIVDALQRAREVFAG